MALAIIVGLARVMKYVPKLSYVTGLAEPLNISDEPKRCKSAST